MTLGEYQTRVHRLYEKDNDVPSSDDEDYIVRTALANDAIGVWNAEEGVLWRELFVSLADAGSGDTTTDGTADYDAPDDFRFGTGFLTLTDSDGNETFYEHIELYKKDLDWDSSEKLWYVTGNVAIGFTIHIMPTPGAGNTIAYSYYKSPATLSSGSDVFEMSDPGFAVYWALAKLKEDEGRGQNELGIAMQKLRAMKTRNQMRGFYQNPQADGIDTMYGFGK